MRGSPLACTAPPTPITSCGALQSRVCVCVCVCVCRGELRFNRVCVCARARVGERCVLYCYEDSGVPKQLVGRSQTPNILQCLRQSRKRRKVLLQLPQNPIEKRSWSLRVLPTLTFEGFTKPCTWKATP